MRPPTSAGRHPAGGRARWLWAPALLWAALLARSWGATGASASPLPRPVLHLGAIDPGYPGGFQVGDELTVTAHITRGRITPGGTVSVTTDERYDRGCRAARLGHGANVVCYLTFYLPGRHKITARYTALDRTVVSATIELTLISPTGA